MISDLIYIIKVFMHPIKLSPGLYICQAWVPLIYILESLCHLVYILIDKAANIYIRKKS